VRYFSFNSLTADVLHSSRNRICDCSATKILPFTTAKIRSTYARIVYRFPLIPLGRKLLLWSDKKIDKM